MAQQMRKSFNVGQKTQLTNADKARHCEQSEAIQWLLSVLRILDAAVKPRQVDTSTAAHRYINYGM